MSVLVLELDAATAQQLFAGIRLVEGELRRRGERPTEGLVAIREVVGGRRGSPKDQLPPGPGVRAHGGERELLTTVEAAEYLRLGRSTVVRLIGSGELPSALMSRRRLVALEDLETYVKRKREEM